MPDTVNSTSGDGYVSYQSDYISESYALALSAVRAYSVGTHVSDTGIMYVKVQGTTDGKGSYGMYIFRGFFCFDLSGYTGKTIKSCDLRIYISTTNQIGTAHVVSASQSSTTTLSTSDYDNVGSTSFGSLTGAIINNWYNITLNAAGIAYLNSCIGGYAKLAMRDDADLYNSYAGGELYLYDSDTAGGLYPPQLYNLIAADTYTKTYTVDAVIQETKTKTYSIDAQIVPEDRVAVSKNAMIEYDLYEPEPGLTRTTTGTFNIYWYSGGEISGLAYFRFNLSAYSSITTLKFWVAVQNSNDVPEVSVLDEEYEIDPETGDLETVNQRALLADSTYGTYVTTLGSGTYRWLSVNLASFTSHAGGYLDIVIEESSGGSTIIHSKTGGTSAPFLEVEGTTGGATYTKTYTIDAIVKATTTKGYQNDVVIAARTTKTYTVDTVIAERSTKTYQVDSVVASRLTKDYQLDSIILEVVTKTYQTDSIIQEVSTKTYQIDAVIITQGTKDYALDSRIVTAVYTMNSVSEGVDTYYTDQQMTDISASNDTYVNNDLSDGVKYHKYKVFATQNASKFDVTWEGRSTIAPSTEPVYLQIYNFNSAQYETIDTENSVDIDVDFTLYAQITTNPSYYYDTQGDYYYILVIVSQGGEF